MVEKDAAVIGGNVIRHLVEQLAINVKGDDILGPVESVLVEHFIRAEVEGLDFESVCSLRSEAVVDGFGALQNQVYSALGAVELMGEELHVDFLRVVVVLRLLDGEVRGGCKRGIIIQRRMHRKFRTSLRASCPRGNFRVTSRCAVRRPQHR